RPLATPLGLPRVGAQRRPRRRVRGLRAHPRRGRRLKAAPLPSGTMSEQSTIVIRPPRGFVALQLGELWRYRELLMFLVWRLVLGVFLAAYGVTPRLNAIVVVPALLLLALATSLGAGLWLAALNVSYRDIQYVVPFVIQIGLFMSMFASNIHSQPWRTLLGLN